MSPDDLWTKALAAAESARTLLEHGDGDGATSRAYYAMFNAARAMLWFTHGVEPGEAKTHATVIRRFSKHFVQNGPLDAEYGRLLMEAAQARMGSQPDLSQHRPSHAMPAAPVPYDSGRFGTPMAPVE